MGSAFSVPAICRHFDAKIVLAILLYAFAVAWLRIPFLVKHAHPFGYYLAWTVFVAMGISESTHFAFPLLTTQPYGFFPGMASVVFLSPADWWGIWRLWHD